MPSNGDFRALPEQSISIARFLKIGEKMKDERGDVPGWVLITLMTAGLVVLMWSIAGPALKTVFEQALTKVATF